MKSFHPTHTSWAQGTMCRQNSPQWRHFFQGNSTKKKWTKKLWSPLVIMKNGLRFVGFSRNCCFGWYFLLVALLPVRENTELPLLVLLMGDALMWQARNFKVHAPPSFFHEEKLTFLRDTVKHCCLFLKVPFPREKQIHFETATWGSCCVDNARFLGFHCTG